MFLVEAGFIDNNSDMDKWNVDAIVSAVIFAYFGSETSGGSAPSQPAPEPPKKRNVIEVGGLGSENLADFVQACNSVHVTASLVLRSDGYIYPVTEPTSDTQLNAMVDYLKRKNYHHTVK
jgi:N-acetylmuramoyl-L-alanine amidase